MTIVFRPDGFEMKAERIQDSQARGDVKAVNMKRHRAHRFLLTLGATADQADRLLDVAVTRQGANVYDGHFRVAREGDGRFGVSYRHKPYPPDDLHAPKFRPDQKEINDRFRKLRSHEWKKPYPTRLAAWRGVFRAWKRMGTVHLDLRPYRCEYDAHYHIGHAKPQTPLGRTILHLVRKNTVWRYYRIRKRVRTWR